MCLQFVSFFQLFAGKSQCCEDFLLFHVDIMSAGCALAITVSTKMCVLIPYTYTTLECSYSSYLQYPNGLNSRATTYLLGEVCLWLDTFLMMSLAQKEEEGGT